LWQGLDLNQYFLIDAAKPSKVLTITLSSQYKVTKSTLNNKVIKLFFKDIQKAKLSTIKKAKV
jgi:hypothetical protein